MFTDFTSKKFASFAWGCAMTCAALFMAAIWIWEEKFFFTGLVFALLAAIFTISSFNTKN